MRFFLLVLFIFSVYFLHAQTKPDPLKQARLLKEREQFEDALKEVTHLIQKDSTVAEYYDFRGGLFYELKMPDEAIADYSKAISLDPSDPFFYHHRANIYYAFQKPDEAIADNNKALQFTTQDSMKYDLLVNRGACYTMKREFQKAYDDYYQALKFDSTNQVVLNNISTVLDELGRSEEAIQYLQKLIRLYPDFIGGYGNLAFQYMQKSEYKKALEYNNKVLELDGNQPLAYNNRGFVKYKLNDLKGALEDVNHSLQLYPQNSYAYKNRALIFIAMKQYSKACADLQMAIQLGFSQMYGDEVKNLLEQYCTRNN